MRTFEQDFDDLFLDNPDLMPQLGETARAYAAFCDYCQMGAGRTVRKLLERYKADKTQLKSRSEMPPSLTFSTLLDWSGANHWQRRVKSYESSRAMVVRSMELTELREMKARHIQRSLAIQDILDKRLEALKPDELTPETLLRYLVVAIQIEREARCADRIELSLNSDDRNDKRSLFDGVNVRFVEVVRTYGDPDADLDTNED